MKTARLALPALLALTLAVPASAAPQDGVEAWVFDLTMEVPVERLATVTDCGGGNFSVDPASHSFEYLEVDPSQASGQGPLPGAIPAGYFDTGCGTATLAVAVPPGTDHVHVRFEADRQVDEFALNPPSRNFVQQLRVRTSAGVQVASVDYFALNATRENMTAFDLPAIALPLGTPGLEVEWYFEDTGFATGQDLPGVLSGEDYRSRVQNATIEFSGARIDGAEVTSKVRRSGTFRSDEVRVEVPVTPALLADFTVDVRIRTLGDLEFRTLEAPDGRDMEGTVTRTGLGRAGFDNHRILLEHPENGLMQVTVADAILRAHGPGTYTVTFEAVRDIRAEPFLVPVALLLLALPVPFAALAVRRVRRFEREAFGGFRRSARLLELALGVVVLYYILVVASAFVGGRLDLMASIPLGTEAVLLYVQVFVAILAFLGLFLVARELDLITRPKPVAEALDGQ